MSELNLLTTKDAAEVLNLKPSTLKLYRSIGRGPVFVKQAPRSIRYRLADLLRYRQNQ